jgi:hypothetical protein
MAATVPISFLKTTSVDSVIIYSRYSILIHKQLLANGTRSRDIGNSYEKRSQTAVGQFDPGVWNADRGRFCFQCLQIISSKSKG